MIKGKKKTFLSIMKFPGQDEIVNIYNFVDRIHFKKMKQNEFDLLNILRFAHFSRPLQEI